MKRLYVGETQAKEGSQKESVMNARIYRVKLDISPLDFPPVNGIVDNSVIY